MKYSKIMLGNTMTTYLQKNNMAAMMMTTITAAPTAMATFVMSSSSLTTGRDPGYTTLGSLIVAFDTGVDVQMSEMEVCAGNVVLETVDDDGEVAMVSCPRGNGGEAVVVDDDVTVVDDDVDDGSVMTVELVRGVGVERVMVVDDVLVVVEAVVVVEVVVVVQNHSTGESLVQRPALNPTMSDMMGPGYIQFEGLSYRVFILCRLFRS